MAKRYCVIGAALLCLLPAVASATPITYIATLTGSNEAPPNVSTATGFAKVVVDPATHEMWIDATFSGLSAGNTAAHIHCCTAVPFTATAGVATTTPTFTGFPTGVTSGTYAHYFDLTLASSYNPAFVTAQSGVGPAEAALLAGLAGGRAYFNIHTSTFPGGEIRGFLAVPDPGSSMLLLGIGLLGLRTFRRRRP